MRTNIARWTHPEVGIDHWLLFKDANDWGSVTTTNFIFSYVSCLNKYFVLLQITHKVRNKNKRKQHYYWMMQTYYYQISKNFTLGKTSASKIGTESMIIWMQKNKQMIYIIIKSFKKNDKWRLGGRSSWGCSTLSLILYIWRTMKYIYTIFLWT